MKQLYSIQQDIQWATGQTRGQLPGWLEYTLQDMRHVNRHTHLSKSTACLAESKKGRGGIVR
ncbi:MAG: hypothetical protein ATN35_01870 [Epulopiscium sp. Nele67-Bin004]|nr:MAG: hypothetical protein ATN35_01870 [Epulopiscium sp. Nele67-Bin004]